MNKGFPVEICAKYKHEILILTNLDGYLGFMKIVFLVAALLLASVHILFHQLEQSRSAAILNILPIYIVNTSTKAVPLYSVKNTHRKAIAYLQPEEGFLYQYAGKSGDWLYGIADKRKVVLKSKKRAKALKLGGHYLLLTALKWMLYGIILFYPIFRFVRQTARTISRISWRKEKPVDIADQLQRANDKLSQELQAEKMRRRHFEAKSVNNYQEKERAEKESRFKNKSQKTGRYAKQQAEEEEQYFKHQLDKAEQYAKEQAEKAKERIDQQVAEESLKKAHQNLKDEFAKKEAEWLEKVRKESETRKDVHVQDMQASYERLESSYGSLKAEYERCKAEAKVFDLNFDGDSHERLLKGRQYEIFFAQLVDRKEGFKILEWTSDKGFEKGIYVEANGNPDFIIGYGENVKFAVECKYRGGTVYDRTSSGRTMIGWATSKQGQRYSKFSQDRSMPVFLALGFLGNSSDPRHNYFVEINELLNKSEYLWIKNKDKKTKNDVIDKNDINTNHFYKSDAAAKITAAISALSQ